MPLVPLWVLKINAPLPLASPLHTATQIALPEATLGGSETQPAVPVKMASCWGQNSLPGPVNLGCRGPKGTAGEGAEGGRLSGAEQPSHLGPGLALSQAPQPEVEGWRARWDLCWARCPCPVPSGLGPPVSPAALRTGAGRKPCAKGQGCRAVKPGPWELSGPERRVGTRLQARGSGPRSAPEPQAPSAAPRALCRWCSVPSPEGPAVSQLRTFSQP